MIAKPHDTTVNKFQTIQQYRLLWYTAIKAADFSPVISIAGIHGANSLYGVPVWRIWEQDSEARRFRVILGSKKSSLEIGMVLR